MIPLLGVIVALYAIARLIQVPIEHSASPEKVSRLTLVSLIAGVLIAFLVYQLLVLASDTDLVVTPR